LGTGVPVFAVNYGEVGFLATVDPDGLEEGLGRALDGDFDAMSLPAIDLRSPGGTDWWAINDVSFHRKPGLRVADLSYAIGRDDRGRAAGGRGDGGPLPGRQGGAGAAGRRDLLPPPAGALRSPGLVGRARLRGGLRRLCGGNGGGPPVRRPPLVHPACAPGAAR